MEHRLTAVEARLGALEARVTEHPGPADPVVDADTFWALQGLAARVTSPGAVLLAGTVDTPTGLSARWQQGALVSDLLEEEWEGCAPALAALGHPVRLELLRHILRGSDTARSLTELDGAGSSGQVYHHLRQLAAAGWLQTRGGRYEVPAERLVPLLTAILGGRR